MKRNVLANDVSVVDEKQHLLPERHTVPFAEILVELFVKLNVVVGVHIQDAVAAVRLVNMVDIPEDVGAETLAYKVAHLVDGRFLENAAEVHDHVKPTPLAFRVEITLVCNKG